MSKVQTIEAELQRLSPEEIREVRAWLEDFLAGQPEFSESHLMTLKEDVTAGAEQVNAGRVAPFDDAALVRIKVRGQKMRSTRK